MMKLYADLIKETTLDRNEWLEDVLAGLLSAGVHKEEIGVHIQHDGAITVTVRGTAKYLYNTTFAA